VVGLDLLDVLEQRVERPAREVVAVEGDQAQLGGDQRRAGVEVERRRGVDEDRVEVVGEFVEGVAQLEDLVAGFELALQLFQIGWEGRMDRLAKGVGGRTRRSSWG
jgi:hypothetical protein